MPITHLGRILWRYRAGYYHQSTLIKAINFEISQLVTAKHQMDGCSLYFHDVTSKLNGEFEIAIEAAKNYLDQTYFGKSVKQVERAFHLLKKLLNVLDTLTLYQQSLEKRDQFLARTKCEPLRRLTTIALVDRLLERAAQLIAEDYRKAAVVVRFCENELLHLQQLGTSPEKIAELLARIDEMQGDAARHEVTRHGLAQDGHLLRMRSLIDEGFLVLAERLMDDLTMLSKSGNGHSAAADLMNRPEPPVGGGAAGSHPNQHHAGWENQTLYALEKIAGDVEALSERMNHLVVR